MFGYHARVSLAAILDRRLSIISGKGGVGKTTLAAVLGIVLSKEGRRTLVAEVEGKDTLATMFGAPPLTTQPAELADSLWGMKITPEESLEEYFDVQLHMKRIAKPLINSQLVDYVTHSAPGLRDILMLGKVWYAAVKRRDFDHIVLDTAAAGHAVSMLRSPEGFLHAVPIGPLANHTKQVLDWLQDPTQVGIHLASMPEEMPINETIETTRLLEEKLGMNVSHVFMNMVYPPISDSPEVEEKIELISSAEDLVAEGLSKKASQEAFRVLDFYRKRRSLQQAHRKELSDELAATADIIDLPFIMGRSFGPKELDQLATIAREQLVR